MCLTVREFSDEVGINIGSCHQFFSEKFQMRRVIAKLVPRLLTDNQRERTVLKSIRHFLPMQMIMKTFLRKSQHEMRLGYIGMMLKPRYNRCSGCGKGPRDQKKRG
jgi:hypothetical protein